jgi:hypothetical protein
MGLSPENAIEPLRDAAQAKSHRYSRAALSWNVFQCFNRIDRELNGLERFMRDETFSQSSCGSLRILIGRLESLYRRHSPADLKAMVEAGSVCLCGTRAKGDCTCGGDDRVK